MSTTINMQNSVKNMGNKLVKQVTKTVVNQVNNQLKNKVTKNDHSSKKQQAFVIDTRDYLGCIDEMFLPKVRGWAGCRNNTESVWVKITKGDECQVILANQARADVLNSGLLANENCGFRAQFSENNTAQAHIEIMMPAVTLTHSKPSYKNRKLFFIHIPKTAGSSVNTSFQKQLAGAPSYTHIEGMKDEWPQINQAGYLSGHVTTTSFDEHFSKHDYVTLAFFRQPHKHLTSHLNWVRHLMEPDKTDFFANHPVVVQQIAKKLTDLDFSSVTTWQQFVKELKPTFFGLFDNLQVRYLAEVKPNERVTQVHLQQAISRLKRIHLVGIAEHFNDSMALVYQAMGFTTEQDDNTRSNVNSFSYGADFSTPELQDVIKPLVQFDLALYKHAQVQFEQQKIKFGFDG